MRLFNGLALGMVMTLIAVFNQAGAESMPLYQQRVETAQPDQEALEHSRKLLKEHKDVEIKEKFVIQPFHKQSGELETAPGAFCRQCHGPLPHSKQLRTRAFNNMHVRYIACETCHFRPENLNFEYRWFDYLTKQPYQGPNLFRLDQGKDNAEQRPANPKIAPFFENEPVFILKDSIFSEQIAKQWKTLEGEEKVLLRAKIHWPLEKKGPECHDCHDEKKSRLDFKALGATDKQVTAITQHVIPQFFRRYKKDDEKITIRDMLH